MHLKNTNQLNVKYLDIVNDLITDDSLKPLSASQGKVLKEILDGLTTGLVFRGSFDIGTQSTFPQSPKTGDFYKVINSVNNDTVIVGGIELARGDSIYYASSNWVKIDNTESADLLRQGNISGNSNWDEDLNKLSTRETIKEYIQGQVDSITVKFINDEVTITDNTGTLAHTPLNGVIFTGVASINNGDGTFDLVECSVSNKVLTIAPDITNKYNGLTAKVTYAYI